MYGIETIQSLNRKNEEAAAFLAKYADADAAKQADQSAPVTPAPVTPATETPKN